MQNRRIAIFWATYLLSFVAIMLVSVGVNFLFGWKNSSVLIVTTTITSMGGALFWAIETK